jgi:hypothetical protein|tara:strand:- start:459 stop:680 length:222 start_codon:yes stop_codon:yes gene_type:complete
MAFSDIFKDDNEYNEKSIIGFGAFAIMVIFAGADVVTGLMGKDLVINDVVYNSFLFTTLGSFGIAGAEKVLKK